MNNMLATIKKTFALTLGLLTLFVGTMAIAEEPVTENMAVREIIEEAAETGLPTADEPMQAGQPEETETTEAAEETAVPTTPALTAEMEAIARDGAAYVTLEDVTLYASKDCAGERLGVAEGIALADWFEMSESTAAIAVSFRDADGTMWRGFIRPEAARLMETELALSTITADGTEWPLPTLGFTATDLSATETEITEAETELTDEDILAIASEILGGTETVEMDETETIEATETDAETTGETTETTEVATEVELDEDILTIASEILGKAETVEADETETDEFATETIEATEAETELELDEDILTIASEILGKTETETVEADETETDEVATETIEATDEATEAEATEAGDEAPEELMVKAEETDETELTGDEAPAFAQATPAEKPAYYAETLVSDGNSEALVVYSFRDYRGQMCYRVYGVIGETEGFFAADENGQLLDTDALDTASDLYFEELQPEASEMPEFYLVDGETDEGAVEMP